MSATILPHSQVTSDDTPQARELVRAVTEARAACPDCTPRMLVQWAADPDPAAQDMAQLLRGEITHAELLRREHARKPPCGYCPEGRATAIVHSRPACPECAAALDYGQPLPAPRLDPVGRSIR